MAYFQRRRGNQVAVYYYDRERQKAVRVRSEDLPPDINQWADADIRQWIVDTFEKQGGVSRQRSRRRTLLGNEEVAKLRDAHLAEHEALNDPAPGTMDEYRYHFDTFIEPFFISKHAAKDIKLWYLHTPEFAAHLETTGKKPSTIRKVCHTLARFGVWLVHRRHLTQPWYIPIPKKKGKRATPLARKADPQDILTAARQLPPIWALDHLLSYFASLRPEETYALEKSDIITSDEARKSAKTWSRFQKYGLGAGMSIRVTKTLIGTEPQHLTKTHYARAVVNVWSVEAARAIAAILREMPDGRLFPGTRPQLNYRYRLQAKPITRLNAQDRRRASANYLGKTVGIDPILLQDHLRHSVMETTLLYTRDPNEKAEDAGAPNYDDVG